MNSHQSDSDYEAYTPSKRVLIKDLHGSGSAKPHPVTTGKPAWFKLVNKRGK